MSGFVTKSEVENNREMICEMWGEAFYAECLKAEGTTFLALLVKFGKL